MSGGPALVNSPVGFSPVVIRLNFLGSRALMRETHCRRTRDYVGRHIQIHLRRISQNNPGSWSRQTLPRQPRITLNVQPMIRFVGVAGQDSPELDADHLYCVALRRIELSPVIRFVRSVLEFLRDARLLTIFSMHLPLLLEERAQLILPSRHF